MSDDPDLSNLSDVSMSQQLLSSASLPYKRGPGRPRKDPNAPPSQRLPRSLSTSIASTRPPRVKANLRLSGSSSSPSTSSPSTPGFLDTAELTDSPLNPTTVPFQPPSDNLAKSMTRCSFCYLPSTSLLGQGDMTMHSASEDFDVTQFPLKREPRPVDESDTSIVDFAQPHKACLQNRPRTKAELFALIERNEVFDEIEVIGLPDDVTLAELIDTNTKQLSAHFCCAAWSDGVIQSQESQLLNVDRAVCSGLEHLCSGCEQYGATISCRHRHCPSIFHYPCASAYGGFLDIKNLVFYCHEHADDSIAMLGSESGCAKCESLDRADEMLFCTLCGQHYHGSCLEPPVNCSLRVRAGWQCPDCKRCQHCQSPKDDSRMLVCEHCDKGYHTYCMTPVLTAIPKVSWKCKFCRVCNDCGSRAPGSGPSSRWHMNYSICDSCYQQRNKGLFCSVCGRAYRYQKHKTMAQCVQCKKQIHFECDTEAARERLDGSEYVCPPCKTGQSGLISISRTSTSYSPSVSNVDDVEEEEQLARLLRDEMAGGSLSGTDSPFSEFGVGAGDFGDVDFMPPTDDLEVPTGNAFVVTEAPCRVPNAPPPRRLAGGNGCVSRKKPAAGKRGRASGQGKGKTGVFRQPGSKRNVRRAGRAGNGSFASNRLSDDSTNGEDSKHNKDDEEYIRTVVVTSNKDEFTFCQDICLICGSLGKGEEGQMIACSHCGQCYHTYCANVKLSKVILERGWRCLDCTVCEKCGNGSDEQNLLLCDECDVSYHIYCLDPPMERIPQGAWRCKWCAKCCRCNVGLSDVGPHHSEDPFNLCTACSSLRKCPKCQQLYKDDELVIICQNCKRWCHGKCEELFGEEMLEQAADRGFRCSFCRPHGTHSMSTNSLLTEAESSMQYTSDFVLLTKYGLETAQWRPQSLPSMSGFTMRKAMTTVQSGSLAGTAHQAIVDTIDQVTAAVRSQPHQEVIDHHSMEFDRMDSYDNEMDVGPYGDCGQQQKRQRGRRPQKLGIGGFIVRPTRNRSSTNEGVVESAFGETSQPTPDEQIQTSALVGTEGELGIEETKEQVAGTPVKVRRRRRPRKSQLEDNYPPMIQKGFFGISTSDESPTLQDTKSSFQSHGIASYELSPRMTEHLRKQQAATEAATNIVDFDMRNSEDAFDEIIHDPEELFSILVNDEQQQQEQHEGEEDDHDFLGIDPTLGIGDIVPSEIDQLINLAPDAPSSPSNRGQSSVIMSDPQSSGNQIESTLTHEPIQPSVPHVTPVSIDHQQPSPFVHHQFLVPPQHIPDPHRMLQPSHSVDELAASFMSTPSTPTTYHHPSSVPSTPSIMPFEARQQPLQPIMPTEQAVPKMTSSGSGREEGGQSDRSNTERWEQDEPLGNRSAIAAVLYANMNYPQLSVNHPNWCDRVKQIQKLWRTLDSAERQRYVQMARDNRAANKQQRTKRQKPPVVKQEINTTSSGPLHVEPTGGSRLPNPAQSPQSNPSPFTGPRTPATPMDQSTPASFSPRMGQPPSVQQPPNTHCHESMRPFSGLNPRIDQSGLCATPSDLQQQFNQTMHLPGGPQGVGQMFKVPPVPMGGGMVRPLGSGEPQYGPTTTATPMQVGGHDQMINRYQQQMARPSSLSIDAKAADGSTPLPMSPTMSPRMRMAHPGTSQHQHLLDDLIEQERREQGNTQTNFSDSPCQQPAQQGLFEQQGQSQWPNRPPIEYQRQPFEQVAHDTNAQIPAYTQQQAMNPQYQSLLQQHQDLDMRMKAFEGDLARLRKQKKNLTAKQRQLRRNVENPQDLAPHDQEALHSLTITIQRLQKDVEPIKKQQKQVTAQLQDYQTKHGIVPPSPSALTVQPTQQQPVPTTPANLTHAGPQFNQEMRSPVQQQSQPQMFSSQQLAMTTGPPRGANIGSNPRMMPPPYPTDPMGHPRPPMTLQQQQQAMLSPSFHVVKGETNPFSEDFIERERAERQGQGSMGISFPPRLPGPDSVSGAFSKPSFVGGNMAPTQFVNLPRPPIPQQLLPTSVVPRPGQDFGMFTSDAATSEPKKKRKKRRKKDDTPESPFGHLKEPGSADSNVGPAGLLQHISEANQLSGFRGVSPMDMESTPVTNFIFDRDVIDVVEFVVQRVSIEIDGEDAVNGNALLKRLLQNYSPNSDNNRDTVNTARLVEAVKQPMPPGQPQRQPRKRIRKSKNKNYQYNSDEYSVFVERVSIELKGLPKITVLEPLPKADRSTCQPTGVTFLPDRPDKPMTISESFGHMSLNFMSDYYTETFGQTPKPLPSSISTPDKNFSPQETTVPVPRQEEIVVAKTSNLVTLPQPNISLLRRRADSPLSLVYDNVGDIELDVSTYNAMKLTVPQDGRVSPDFKLMAHFPVRPVPPDPPIEQFIDKMSASNESHTGLVPVSLTLDVEAAKNVESVMHNLALLLNCAPIKYDVEIDTPPQTPEKVTVTELGDRIEVCRQCEKSIRQYAVRKQLAELGLTPNDEMKDYAYFCCDNCYFKFAVVRKAPLTDEEIRKASEADPNIMQSLSKLNRDMAHSVGKESVTATVNKVVSDGKVDDLRMDEIIESVVVGVQAYTVGGTKEKPIHVRDLPQPGVESTIVASGSKTVEKRWKGHRWQLWNKSAMTVFNRLRNELDTMVQELRKCFSPKPMPEDHRRCQLCNTEGDGDSCGAGRMLNMDADRWVHVNCALWSSEVYETISGALINVDQAVNRGGTSPCSLCLAMGATLQCYKVRCEKHYHFPCALKAGCSLMKDKTVFCSDHCTGISSDHTLSATSVLRRIYVERDENRLIAKLFQQGEAGGLALRVGSLIFHHVGQLLPLQLNSKTFHNKDYIFPVGYSVTRFYWSACSLHRRVRYECSIGEKDSSPQFMISFKDELQIKQIKIADKSANVAWDSILTPLATLRNRPELLSLFPKHLKGEMLFGLCEPSILKMIESLPGVDSLMTYSFKHGGSPLMDLPLAVNPSGCARCEPRFRTYIKRHCTVHAGTSSSSSTGGSSSSLTEYQLLLQASGISADMLFANPFYQRFEVGGSGPGSKWTQYKKMQQEMRNTVYLGRSRIQGLGLYAKRDIDMNSMIIEYIGEVIRNEVVEKREKLYTQQNRGVYMFRIDSEQVVDATMAGGPARYVNHSCDPNCSTQLLTMSNGDTKIIIMACRPISKGEELTYDYQFDFEDQASKLPCLCGAPNCRKWMN